LSPLRQPAWWSLAVPMATVQRLKSWQRQSEKG